jgi:hypothetical protein
MCYSMNIERYNTNVKYVFYTAFIVSRPVRISHYTLYLWQKIFSNLHMACGLPFKKFCNVEGVS